MVAGCDDKILLLFIFMSSMLHKAAASKHTSGATANKFVCQLGAWCVEFLFIQYLFEDFKRFLIRKNAERSKLCRRNSYIHPHDTHA